MKNSELETRRPPIRALYTGLGLFAALLLLLFVTDLRVLAWGGVLLLALAAPLMALWRRSETGVAGPEPSEPHPRGSHSSAA